MQDFSAAGSSNNSNFCGKEEDKSRDLGSIIRRLKLSLAINGPKLSKSQVELNDQKQEDE
jgi:hypothetical protein